MRRTNNQFHRNQKIAPIRFSVCGPVNRGCEAAPRPIGLSCNICSSQRPDVNPKVYIETTVISYLVAAPSRDVIVAAHQQITDEWWKIKRQFFDLFASQLVLREAKAGDNEMAQRRLAALQAVALLEVTDEAVALAENLISQGPVPRKAAEDALHIAVAVVNGLDYLLTWNCKHIANAKMRDKIDEVCQLQGYEPIIICTPEELFED